MQERGALVVSELSALDADATSREASARRTRPGWVYLYIAIQFGCQLALLTEALAPARVLFRSMAFGASLFMLVAIRGRPAFRHPSRYFALAVLTIISLAALNPEGSTLLAVVAHLALYVAVIAPVFWTMRLELTETTFARLITILWAFGTLSAAVGILQIYYPGEFQPALSAAIRPESAQFIHLSSGAWVLRPMGLTDGPGGAAGGGFDAALFGICIALTRRFRGATVVGILSMVIGITCIYLSHIRSTLVTLAICCIALLGIFAASGRVSRFFSVGVLATVVALLGFKMAFSLAGDTVATRVASLFSDDPATVYRMNRGSMVASAFTELLPQYPLGAGLGRWGMVSVYFGHAEDGLPCEVQWAGWVADGGIFLILAYPLAVVAAIWSAVRIAITSKSNDHSIMAGIVAAHGIGTLAMTFSYAVFMSGAGIQFWLLNAVLIRCSGPLRTLARRGTSSDSPGGDRTLSRLASQGSR